jgi:hypothetical protein
MLVKRKSERDKTKYLSYDKLREFVRNKKLRTKNDYVSYLSNYCEYEGYIVPYNPSTFYSKDIWEGWSIFLRDEIYKKNYNNTYYSYTECKEEIKKYCFTSKNDFNKRIKEIIKENIRIPYSPNTIYKDEWEGWIIFLNTDNDIEQINDLVDFDSAKKYAHSLNLKLSKQWELIKFGDLPIGMTKKPNILYKDKGWKDWYDFLGIDRKTNMSYGELLISTYLDNNNIKYLYDKGLKDCKSPKSKLRFDFYLPDYNICIEFDGKQHFECIEYFGGIEEFEKVKIRDRIKDDWCLVNDIKLIRFNYKQSSEEIENILNEKLILNKELN